MNHLRTGNSFFAQGSYKSYKFLGNELQETGFYDMNVRFYMADLGRFGQHDPLSASTFDPYGYGYNNPIFFADPTGLEGEPVPGGSGPGGPAAIGTASSPVEIQEIVLNAPLRAVSGNNLATCSYCMTGQGQNLRQQLNIPPPPLPTGNYVTCGHCFDGPIRFIGGAGDPLGIFELLGIATSASDNSNMKLAMLPILMVTKNGDDALKMLAAEKGILSAEKGAFSVVDWTGYPISLPKPTGPFKLLEGVEYDAARKAANNANRVLHKANPEFKGLQIHEIHPVKFGGDPTNPLNKALLTPEEHRLYNTFWFKLQNSIKK